MKKEKIIRIILLVITIALNIFIIANGFIKGSESGEISNSTARVVADVINSIEEDTIPEIAFPSFAKFFRKFAGHFCLFNLSGFLSTLTLYFYLKDTRFNFHVYLIIFSLVIGLFVAVISELAQIVTIERVASFKDVLIDFTGYFLGHLIVLICLIIARSKIFKKS